jgi:hypothetical protein
LRNPQGTTNAAESALYRHRRAAFYRVGGRCLYDEEVLMAWAAEQRSPYATSTSQLDILRTRAKAA